MESLSFHHANCANVNWIQVNVFFYSGWWNVRGGAHQDPPARAPQTPAQDSRLREPARWVTQCQPTRPPWGLQHQRAGRHWGMGSTSPSPAREQASCCARELNTRSQPPESPPGHESRETHSRKLPAPIKFDQHFIRWEGQKLCKLKKRMDIVQNVKNINLLPK